ncbi:MAG TPA: hypothetical protein V6D03_14945 [Candidatus Caenarcaniphilales bacterium]
MFLVVASLRFGLWQWPRYAFSKAQLRHRQLEFWQRQRYLPSSALRRLHHANRLYARGDTQSG